jgi:tryptophan-rich sensory protein
VKKTIGAVLVFILTYALFSAAGFLFPVDRDWYDALHKPEWTPSGSAIGIIWAILFALISLAAAFIQTGERLLDCTFHQLHIESSIQLFSVFPKKYACRID